MRFPIYPITRQDESFVDSHPCHSTNPHFARLVVTGRRCSNSGTRRRGPLTKTAVTRNGDEFGIAWYCIVWYFIMVHGIACQCIAQCVHWTVFFPFDRARWDTLSNLETVILLNIYLSQRTRSKGTMRKLDFREPQTLNL